MVFVNDAGGGGAASQAAQEAAARAAREAAERAAREAAERAAQEAQRQRLAELNADGPVTQTVDTRVFDPPGQTPPPPTTTAGQPSYTASEAYSLYRAGEIAAADATAVQTVAAQPPMPGVPVPVETGGGPAGIVDDWYRAGKASIGVGDPGTYDSYMYMNRRGLQQLAEALDPSTAGDPFGVYQTSDPSTYTSAMAAPAMAALQQDNPDASFQLLAVERPDPSLQPSALVIQMTTADGEAQQYLIDLPQPSMSLVGSGNPAGEHTVQVLTDDPALLQQWYETAQPTLADIGMDYGDAAMSLRMAVGTGYIPQVVETIQAMPEEAQQAFLQDFAASWLTEMEVPPDQVIVTADATGILAGDASAPITSSVNLDAVDGLADSTSFPPIGTSQQDWRQTMEALAANPPSSIAELESEIVRLSDGVTLNEIEELKASDPNALPALLNSLTPYPEIGMNTDLQLQFGAADGEANYYSISYDADAGAVVVETSIDKLLGDQSDLDQTYAISDVPMTVRIPFPDGASIDWSNPSATDLQALNEQVASIGSTSLFLHGYQSTRAAWTNDMQAWMDALPGDTVGIAMAGMGSEGHFLGSGDSPLTARQYAYHTLEAVDRLGLFGGELNVFGHSMGGAAALEFGLAIDRMVADGQARPDVSYVLAEPAPTGDSVPFLTTNATWLSSTAIGITNWAGTSDVAWGSVAWVAEQLNHAVGPFIVDQLVGDDAPGYVREDNSGFADGAGFEQLRATASGLTGEAEPDPDAVAAFMANNPVLVFAGNEDRIVSTTAVHGIFETGVVDLEGGHYAHLSDPAALDHLEAFFAPPPAPTAPSMRGRR